MSKLNVLFAVVLLAVFAFMGGNAATVYAATSESTFYTNVNKHTGELKKPLSLVPIDNDSDLPF